MLLVLGKYENDIDLFFFLKNLINLFFCYSFHVGSGCYDENAYVDAIHRARFVFDQAAELGFNFHLLDIGGGFSFSHKSDIGITFEKIAAVLGPAIDESFPSNIRVIAEPGRYYAAPAFTIATHIIARRTVRRDIEEKYIPNMNADQDCESPTRDEHPTFMCKNYSNISDFLFFFYKF
jgi:ornithine decarboxylase